MSWASETARLRALMRRIVVASAAAGAGGGALCAAACDASKGTAERGSDAADEPVSPVADAEVDAAEGAPGDDAADGALWPPGCTRQIPSSTTRAPTRQGASTASSCRVADPS